MFWWICDHFGPLGGPSDAKNREFRDFCPERVKIGAILSPFSSKDGQNIEKIEKGQKRAYTGPIWGSIRA